jgi:hypothetical protein
MFTVVIRKFAQVLRLSESLQLQHGTCIIHVYNSSADWQTSIPCLKAEKLPIVHLLVVLLKLNNLIL